MLVHDKEALEDILVNRKKRAIGRGDDIIKEAVKKNIPVVLHVVIYSIMILGK